jgi:hypothetical protein
MSTMDYKNEEKILVYIYNMDERINIFLLCNILCSQLSFTANMRKIQSLVPIATLLHLRSPTRSTPLS